MMVLVPRTRFCVGQAGEAAQHVCRPVEAQQKAPACPARASIPWSLREPHGQLDGYGVTVTTESWWASPSL